MQKVLLTELEDVELTLRQPLHCTWQHPKLSCDDCPEVYGDADTLEDATTALRTELCRLFDFGRLFPEQPASPETRWVLQQIETVLGPDLPRLGVVHAGHVTTCDLLGGWTLVEPLEISLATNLGAVTVFCPELGWSSCGNTPQRAVTGLLVRCLAAIKAWTTRLDRLAPKEAQYYRCLHRHLHFQGQPLPALPEAAVPEDLPVAEFRPGLHWDCPDCGEVNVLHVPMHGGDELSQGDAAGITTTSAYDPDHDSAKIRCFGMAEVAETPYCKRCGCQVRLVPFGIEDADPEDEDEEDEYEDEDEDVS